MAKKCDFCSERAVVGFYIGDGSYTFACHDHFPEAEKKLELSHSFILNGEAEKVVDKTQKKSDGKVLNHTT